MTNIPGYEKPLSKKRCDSLRLALADRFEADLDNQKDLDHVPFYIKRAMADTAANAALNVLEEIAKAEGREP